MHCCSRATVAITENYIAGEDELAVTSLADGMFADFDTTTGTLTITGFASAYEYEQVLQSIIFVDTAGYRTPGQIVIAYRVFDGLQASDLETLILNIEAAPYISGDIDNVLVYEQGREFEMIGAGLTIESQASLTGAIVTISEGFNANEDELTFTSRNGIAGSFNATTGELTLTGNASASDYESALESIGYRSTRYNPIAGERVVSFQILAGSAISNAVQAYISVEPETVPPDISTGGTTTYTENGAPVPIAPLLLINSKDAPTPLSVDAENLYGAQVAILNYVDGEDFLSFTPTGDIVGEFDAAEGRIFFVGEGTLDEYESLLRSVVCFNTSNAPTTAARQISIRLLDSGANGLSNQVITTEVILGLPDPVQLERGSADDITLLTNDEPVSLGLDDLVFSSVDRSDSTVELRATLRTLPPEGLGRVVLLMELQSKKTTLTRCPSLAALGLNPLSARSETQRSLTKLPSLIRLRALPTQLSSALFQPLGQPYDGILAIDGNQIGQRREHGRIGHLLRRHAVIDAFIPGRQNKIERIEVRVLRLFLVQQLADVPRHGSAFPCCASRCVS